VSGGRERLGARGSREETKVCIDLVRSGGIMFDK
jgi:hypothetical protein